MSLVKSKAVKFVVVDFAVFTEKNNLAVVNYAKTIGKYMVTESKLKIIVIHASMLK